MNLLPNELNLILKPKYVNQHQILLMKCHLKKNFMNFHQFLFRCTFITPTFIDPYQILSIKMHNQIHESTLDFTSKVPQQTLIPKCQLKTKYHEPALNILLGKGSHNQISSISKNTHKPNLIIEMY